MNTKEMYINEDEKAVCDAYRHMRKRRRRLRPWARVFLACVAAVLVMFLFSLIAGNATALDKRWVSHDGRHYWVEDGVVQGTVDDPKNARGYGTPRGREIYDPASNAWYWLDACYDGARAEDKEVWMPYVYQDERPGSTEGKWCRYSVSGGMVKGWLFDIDDDCVYYYDLETGAMAKGWRMFGINDMYGRYYDKTTGRMRYPGGAIISASMGWQIALPAMAPGEKYWVKSGGHVQVCIYGVSYGIG